MSKMYSPSSMIVRHSSFPHRRDTRNALAAAQAAAKAARAAQRAAERAERAAMAGKNAVNSLRPSVIGTEINQTIISLKFEAEENLNIAILFAEERDAAREALEAEKAMTAALKAAPPPADPAFVDTPPAAMEPISSPSQLQIWRFRAQGIFLALVAVLLALLILALLGARICSPSWVTAPGFIIPTATVAPAAQPTNGTPAVGSSAANSLHILITSTTQISPSVPTTVSVTTVVSQTAAPTVTAASTSTDATNYFTITLGSFTSAGQLAVHYCPYLINASVSITRSVFGLTGTLTDDQSVAGLIMRANPKFPWGKGLSTDALNIPVECSW